MELVNIDSKRKYWLVRTQGGQYYEEFIKGNYVAIGWDEFDDLSYLTTSSKDTVVELIRQKYKDEKRPGYIYGQMITFIKGISDGDIVMIPSKDSKLFYFGVITGDPYIANENNSGNEFVKRRKVRWIKELKRRELDPYLYNLIYTQGTVSNATKLGEYIDRSIHSFFVKGDKAHIIFRVSKKKGILVNEFLPLVSNATKVIEDISMNHGENIESARKVEMKTNVQSPGVIELIFLTGGAVAGAVAVYKFFKYIYHGITELDREIEQEYIDDSEELDLVNLQQQIEEIKHSMEELGIKPSDEFLEKKGDSSEEG